MSLFRWTFERYARRKIGRGLDGLWVAGLERAREQQRQGPVVFAATHVAWWDGLVLLALDEALGRTGRVWMDAQNLRALPYFSRLGALPLHREGPGLRQSVRTALVWLEGPGRALWVFPQGEQRPSWLRPLGLAAGAGRVAQMAGATLVPVGLQYGFRQAPVPSAVLSFGEPVPAPELEAGLLRELARTDAFLLGEGRGFVPLVPGRTGGTQDSLAARLLAWGTRG